MSQSSLFLPRFSQFFFNKPSSDCYKLSVNSHSSEKVDSHNFCQFLIAFIEEKNFRGFYLIIFADASLSLVSAGWKKKKGFNKLFHIIWISCYFL